MPRIKRSQSFANNIIYFIFIFMLIIFTVSVLINRYFVSRIMLRNVQESTASIAHENILLIDNKLDRVKTMANILRYIKENAVIGDDKIDDYVFRMLRINSDLTSICISYDPKMDSIHKNRIYSLVKDQNNIQYLARNDFLYKDWFQIPQFTQSDHWSEPWYDEFGFRELITSYSVPIRRNNEVVGVVRMDIALDNLSNIIKPLRIKQTGFAFLISNNGTIITHPADSLMMHYTIFDLAEQYDDPGLRQIGQEMIRGNTGFRKIDGEGYFRDKWIYFLPLSSTHWSMAIIIDRKEIFADLSSLIFITILTSIITFLATAWIIYFKTYQTHRPLHVLAKAANQIGSGEFNVDLPVSTKIYEIQTLTDSFAMMQESLKEYIANLKRITEEKNKIFSDVVFASDIQKSLIPQNTDYATTRQEIRAFGILEPAGEIGGDLYDYFMIDDNHFCFGIADVLGKGIVAAMTMTMVTTLLRSIAPYYATPYEMLSTLNAFLCKNEQESNFVTIILGVIDLRTGQLCFSNAGHVPLYLRKNNRRVIRFGETHSTAIGVFDDIKIGSEILQLDPGDELIMFTDGITEAMSSKEILFGTERLEEILNKLQNPLPETTASAILNGVRQFSDPDQFRDDITILIIEFIHPRK